MPTPTSRRRRRTRTTTALLSASLLATTAPAFAGDGDADGKSAEQLAASAKKELLDAKSLHLTMRNSTEEQDTRTPAAIDLRLDEDGNCTGELRMGTGGERGGSVDLVKRGDEVWMKPDATFWKTQLPGRSGEAAAQLFGDRYVHGDADDPVLDGLAGTCDLDTFRKQLKNGSDRATKAELTKGDQKKVADTTVVPLSAAKGKERTTLYVTADAPHRLVRATEKSADGTVSMTLTDYNKPVPSKTPSADDSVDIDELRNTAPTQAPHA